MPTEAIDCAAEPWAGQPAGSDCRYAATARQEQKGWIAPTMYRNLRGKGSLEADEPAWAGLGIPDGCARPQRRICAVALTLSRLYE